MLKLPPGLGWNSAPSTQTNAGAGTLGAAPGCTFWACAPEADTDRVTTDAPVSSEPRRDGWTGGMEGPILDESKSYDHPGLAQNPSMGEPPGTLPYGSFFRLPVAKSSQSGLRWPEPPCSLRLICENAHPSGSIQ